MTPEEKAKELYLKYIGIFQSMSDKITVGTSIGNEAKQCALICVEEILNSNPMGDDDSWDVREIGHEACKFWEDVKECLTNL